MVTAWPRSLCFSSPSASSFILFSSSSQTLSILQVTSMMDHHHHHQQKQKQQRQDHEDLLVSLDCDCWLEDDEQYDHEPVTVACACRHTMQFVPSSLSLVYHLLTFSQISFAAACLDQRPIPSFTAAAAAAAAVRRLGKREDPDFRRPMRYRTLSLFKHP